CSKCGSRAELVKAGSSRFWVQCVNYAGQGNCTVIGAQADNKKEAIYNWNSKR
ncbi:Lar family restriction alleviation protein, partial [Craterilacuibacter sp.]|uniref:Lar family restriction alleviation protein n=1 Tax=Craterilacuibacter sp. TaxID=2870909 RepID=UPI003F3836AF